jgi:hypothetical protein
LKLKLTLAGSVAVVLVASVAMLALGGTAIAAGTSVTLKAKGEYAKRHRTACGKTKNFRVFHRGASIEFRGFVTPPPAGHFPVRIKLERCTRGHFRAAGDRSITGKKLTGKFKGFISAKPLASRSRNRRAIVYYLARAIVAGGESPKEYFAVTR